MRFKLFAIASVLTASMVGCAPAPQPKPPENKGEVHLDVPGAKVDVVPGKGVEVNTPGADVKVEPAPEKK